MKKLLSIILVFMMLLSNIVVFAETQNQDNTASNTKEVVEQTINNKITSTENSDTPDKIAVEEKDNEESETVTAENTTEDFKIEEILNTTNSVPEQQVEDAVKIDDEEKLLQEEKVVINDINKDAEITKENYNRVIKNTYKYLSLRDLYYKKVLLTAKRIKNIAKPELKKAAVIKFEQKLQSARERDKEVHQKIEKLLKFIKENKSNLSLKEKLSVNKILRPLVKKYYAHRAIIASIHKNIENIKKLSYRNELKIIAALAEKQVKNGDMEKAKQYYEKLTEKGLAETETYKKLGTVLQNIEGKGPKVFVKGIRPNFDVKPVIKDGRTLVPFRAIAEALKADVQWDEANRAVVLVKGSKKVIVPINKNYIVVNGEQKEIDVPASIVEDRTVVPLRVVSEALDTNVTWDGETEVITVEDNVTVPAAAVTTAEVEEIGIENAEEIIQSATEEQAVQELEAIDESSANTDIDSIE